MGILSRLGLRKEDAIPHGKSLGGKMVTVGLGDTLRKIAGREYGDEEMWDKIYEANASKIGDADHLEPGMTLRLP